MQLTAIYQYPIKSLGGQLLNVAQPLERGLRDDRRWMFVDGDGQFITQRTCRTLAQFRAETVGETGLRITRVADEAQLLHLAEARPTSQPATAVTLWDDAFLAAEVSSPQLAAATTALGIPGARLMYMNADTTRPVDPQYARLGEQVSFADGYPYLIVNEASLADLSARFAAAAVNRVAERLDVRRFRPNLVVSGPTAFAEDDWGDVTIGSHSFYAAKPCARCNVIKHHPDTGEVNRDVLRVLSGYRRTEQGKVLFGTNLCWTGGTGMLKVGDSLSLKPAS